MPNLKFHHVGCVVKSIEEALEAYRPIARRIAGTIPIRSQGVNVCFVEIAPESHVELVEPMEGESAVGRLLGKRVTYYHLGFLTPEFEPAVESLVNEGYHHLSTFQSEAFEMRRCAFLVSPVAHLIEIIEDPAVDS